MSLAELCCRRDCAMARICTPGLFNFVMSFLARYSSQSTLVLGLYARQSPLDTHTNEREYNLNTYVCPIQCKERL